jgi:hypothetical protein
VVRLSRPGCRLVVMTGEEMRTAPKRARVCA